MKLPTSLDDVPSRQEIILFVLVIFLGVVAFFRTVYLVEVARGKELQAQLEVLHLEKEAVQKFEQAIQVRQARREQAKKRAPNVRLQILAGERSPALKDLTGLVGHITSDSFLRGIQLKSIEYQPLQKGVGFGHTVIQIEGSGRYLDIVEYFARLEQLDILLNMERIALVSGEGGDLSFEWKADYYEVRDASQGA